MTESEPTHHRPLVEVCVGSVADARVAQACGANRIELCGATELGGLTPSMTLVDQVLAAVDIPVVVMIRPRAGGFCYSDDEFETALGDATQALDRGAAGIVFGFLQSSAEIDVDRVAKLVGMAGDRETVFHRAFEFVPDPIRACEQLIEAGVRRILTSGQAIDAETGSMVIRELVEVARGRIEILAGGGIRSHNVGKVVELTGVAQVHVGASTELSDKSLSGNSEINFNAGDSLAHDGHRAVERDKLATIIEAVTTDRSQ